MILTNKLVLHKNIARDVYVKNPFRLPDSPNSAVYLKLVKTVAIIRANKYTVTNKNKFLKIGSE